ncbi:hypothetical protein BU15DRAFT_70443 [Melanogaster broomeanus]|nr:hypothetical protein BU15DRAFT_70443 [Melanogaster broomeanus]
MVLGNGWHTLPSTLKGKFLGRLVRFLPLTWNPGWAHSTVVVVSTFHALSIAVTSFRLWYRSWKRQLWWEDAWAGVGMAAAIVNLVSIWFVTAPPGDAGRIIAYWHLIIAFTTCLWSTRLSIVCSIIRLSPRGGRLWKVAIISAAAFSIMFLSLLVQKIYYCAHDTWWYSLEQINCHLGTTFSATQLSMDITSDISLVILPVQLVREVNVSRDQRIIVLSVFSSSILVSLISAVHFAFMLEPDVYSQILTAQLEIALSGIVCNLLVIVTCIYRLLRRTGLDVDRRYTAAEQTVCFTTIVDIDDLASHPRREWSSAERGTKVDSYELQENHGTHKSPELQ